MKGINKNTSYGLNSNMQARKKPEKNLFFIWSLAIKNKNESKKNVNVMIDV